MAGKPIPGFLCRVISPESVLLAMHDRANQVESTRSWIFFREVASMTAKRDLLLSRQLNVSEDRLTVGGHKFYCTIRSNHYVNRGSWYFEAKIVDMPDGSATRIGWAQKHANLQVIHRDRVEIPAWTPVPNWWGLRLKGTSFLFAGPSGIRQVWVLVSVAERHQVP